MSSLHLATEFLAQLPDPGGPLEPPGGDKVKMVFQWGLWIACLCAIGGVVFVAARMGIEHNRGLGGGEAATSLWKPLAACILIANATGIPAALMTFH